SVTFNPARPAVFEFVAGVIERLLHRRWHPEVERVADERAVESFRRHADDGVLNAVHILRFANDVRIAFVTIFPRHVTYDCDRMRVASRAFFGSKAAAKKWPHAKGVKMIRGHHSSDRTLGAVPNAQRCACDFIDNERLKKRRVLFEIEKVWIRKSFVTLGAADGGVECEHSILMRYE